MNWEGHAHPQKLNREMLPDRPSVKIGPLENYPLYSILWQVGSISTGTTTIGDSLIPRPFEGRRKCLVHTVCAWDNCICYTSLRLLFSAIMHLLLMSRDVFVECGMWEIFRLFPSCHNGSSLSVLIQSHYYWLFLYPSKSKRRDV